MAEVFIPVLNGHTQGLLSQTRERLDVMYKWDNSMHFQTVAP